MKANSSKQHSDDGKRRDPFPPSLRLDLAAIATHESLKMLEE